jgi:hypothetical protein
VLEFLALEMVMANTDGYWTRASDYNIYEDAGGKFHIIPHDFNEGLGGDTHGFGGFSPRAGPELDPLTGLSDTTKPLRTRLLAIPSLRARYLGYVREIADKWLDWKWMGPLAARYQALIAADIKTDTRKLYSIEEFEQGLS